MAERNGGGDLRSGTMVASAAAGLDGGASGEDSGVGQRQGRRRAVRRRRGRRRGAAKPHARHAEPGQERMGVFLILLDQVERPKLHYLSLFWKRARQPNMRAWLHLFVNGESKF